MLNSRTLTKDNYHSFECPLVFVAKLAIAISNGKLPEHVRSEGYYDTKKLKQKGKRIWRREYVKT